MSMPSVIVVRHCGCPLNASIQQASIDGRQRPPLYDVHRSGLTIEDRLAD